MFKGLGFISETDSKKPEAKKALHSGTHYIVEAIKKAKKNFTDRLAEHNWQLNDEELLELRSYIITIRNHGDANQTNEFSNHLNQIIQIIPTSNINYARWQELLNEFSQRDNDTACQLNKPSGDKNTPTLTK